MDKDDWESQIISGLRYRRHFGGSDAWATYRGYCRGDFPQYENSPEVHVLSYNLSYALTEVLLPTIYYKNPHVFASPRRPGMQGLAKLLEGVDNWLVQELGVKEQVRAAVKDCIQCGRGIIKLGYEEEEVLEHMKEYYDYIDQKPMGMPWVKRIDPVMFLVPFGTLRLADADWADHIILKPLEKVKSSKMYKNTGDLTGTHMDRSVMERERPGYGEALSDAQEFVEIHEIRNRVDREILAHVMGYDKFIRSPDEDVLQIDGLPFVTFTFNEDPEFFWAVSDMAIIEPQQLEMNEVRTQTMLHRRLALLKILVRKGVLDDEEMHKLMRGDIMSMVQVNVNDIQSAVKELQHHIPQDLLVWAERVRNDVREMMGVGRQQAGTTSSSRTTATESRIVQLAHDMRMSSRRDRVGDAYTEIIRKLNQIILSFWTQSVVVPILGVDGSKYWVELTPDQIKKEFMFDVDVSARMPQNKEIRRQEMIQLIQALGKNPNVNLNYLLRAFLQEFEWLDILQVFPQAQETAGGPMGTSQFLQQQARLQDHPQELRARAGENSKYLQSSAPALVGAEP